MLNWFRIRFTVFSILPATLTMKCLSPCRTLHQFRIYAALLRRLVEVSIPPWLTKATAEISATNSSLVYFSVLNPCPHTLSVRCRKLFSSSTSIRNRYSHTCTSSMSLQAFNLDVYQIPFHQPFLCRISADSVFTTCGSLAFALSDPFYHNFLDSCRILLHSFFP